jgi:tetratricopeptide (TPR) repeat protein
MQMKLRGLILIFLFLIFGTNLLCQNTTEFREKITGAEQQKDTLALARGWYSLAKFYDGKGKIQKSNGALIKALFYARSIKNEKAISAITNYLASNYSYVGEADSAIRYYTIALNAGFANGDSTRIPTILINIGNEYSNIGKFVKAANYSISAIRIKELLKDSTDLAYYYQKVGEVYKTADENKKWEEYVQKAYRLIDNEKYASLNAVAAIYNDLGGIAEAHNNFEQALLYYDTLITIGTENNYNRAIGVALSNRATVLKNMGQIDEALESALKGREYRHGVGYQNIYDNNLLAELYWAKKNTDEAEKYAAKAVHHKLIENYPDEKMRAFRNLYQIKKSSGNYRDALYWNEKFKSLSDSIRNKEIRTQIIDLEIGYQTEKKEQQIELLTTENQLKTNRIRAAIVIVAILVLLIIMIVYILQIRKKQAALKQNILQQQVLRSQMNPHFIFNILGSIQNFMMQNDTQKASAFLSKFATLTRATLNNSAAETITLANEISMLENYIELEKMRSNNGFNFRIDYNDDLEVDLIQIPPMLIQPFVENSIKHGFVNLDRSGLLKIDIIDKIDWIEFIIEDNGNGITEKDKKETGHKSMAMEIFEKRRKLIQQKYKKDFKFELVNLKDINLAQSGVRVVINIPIIDND